MNPDQTPAAHLPATLPSPAALLHRTQAALGLLRDVVQESSAEYWYERGKSAMERREWDEAADAFQVCLARNQEHWRAVIQLTAVLIQQEKYNEAADYFEQVYSEPKISWSEFNSELSEPQWSNFNVLGIGGMHIRTAGVKRVLVSALLSCIGGNDGGLQYYVIELIDLYSEVEYDKIALFHWLEGKMRAYFGEDNWAHTSYLRCLYRKPNFGWARTNKENLPVQEQIDKGDYYH